MPNTNPPSDTAKRFCDFHNDSLAIPDFLRVDEAEQKRRAADRPKGRLRWTRDMVFKDDARQQQDPSTLKLLAEREAAERAKAKKKSEDQREARIIKARQKAKPPAAESAQQGDETMATKTAKKTTTAAKKGKAQPKTGAKRQAKAASKKSATEKARTPVAAGERSRYDWKGAEEKALAGTIPPKPDFSAATHARFLPIMEEIGKACAAKDLKALKAIEINPISSTPKAMDRYRGLCVKALTGAK